ncbi:hypothetical protein PFISCL1PPCAC_10431, partial [Pristionchus fissidentatus]
SMEGGGYGRQKHFHRADLLHGKCEDAPSIVEAVQFHGVRITKGDALLQEVAELYKSSNVDELVKNCHLAARHLQEVGLMDNAAALIDTAPSKNGYIVNFVVREPKSFTLGAKVGMSTQGDADMSMHAARHSVNGRGEVADASYTYTVKGDHSFNVSLSKPLLGWQRYSGIASSLSRSFAYLPWNKSNLEENSLVLGYHNNFWGRKLLQQIRLNAIWRTLLATKESAFAVREHAGHTLKVSAEHEYSFDTRDRPILATKGVLAKFGQELAGAFGIGDAAFVRHQLDIQAAAPLFSKFFLAASFHAKRIESMGQNELHLLDRVYLGGQSDLRGFALNSIGTRIDSSCVGGGCGVAGAVHLYRPLFPADSLFAHAFVASGSVASVRSRNLMRDLVESQRVSVGAGVTFVFKNILRLELNYVHALKKTASDSFSRGLHFGAGINFM